MSRFATPIDDLMWGGYAVSPEPPATADPPSEPAGEPAGEAFPPQLLYPSSAPQEPQPVPPPPLPTVAAPASRTDLIVMALAAVVLVLLFFIVHLNSKLNSLQMMVTFMATRSSLPARP